MRPTAHSKRSGSQNRGLGASWYPRACWQPSFWCGRARAPAGSSSRADPHRPPTERRRMRACLTRIFMCARACRRRRGGLKRARGALLARRAARARASRWRAGVMRSSPRLRRASRASRSARSAPSIAVEPSKAPPWTCTWPPRLTASRSEPRSGCAATSSRAASSLRCAPRARARSGARACSANAAKSGTGARRQQAFSAAPRRRSPAATARLGRAIDRADEKLLPRAALGFGLGEPASASTTAADHCARAPRARSRQDAASAPPRPPRRARPADGAGAPASSADGAPSARTRAAATTATADAPCIFGHRDQALCCASGLSRRARTRRSRRPPRACEGGALLAASAAARRCALPRRRRPRARPSRPRAASRPRLFIAPCTRAGRRCSAIGAVDHDEAARAVGDLEQPRALRPMARALALVVAAAPDSE